MILLGKTNRYLSYSRKTLFLFSWNVGISPKKGTSILRFFFILKLTEKLKNVLKILFANKYLINVFKPFFYNKKFFWKLINAQNLKKSKSVKIVSFNKVQTKEINKRVWLRNIGHTFFLSICLGFYV